MHVIAGLALVAAHKLNPGDGRESRQNRQMRSALLPPESLHDSGSANTHLLKHSAFTFLGQAAPLAVGIIATPVILRGLGTEQFGLLALAWIIIGYFGLFDMGLGRALTKVIAEKLAYGDDGIPDLTRTCLLLMFLLGLAATTVLVLSAHLIVYHLLNIPPTLRLEVLWSLYLLALSVPFTVTASALLGVLQAYQRFDLSAILSGLTVYAYLCPVIALQFSRRLAPTIALLLCGRVVVWLAHLICCYKAVPTAFTASRFRSSLVKPLVQFGGWLTISGIVSPLMVTLDRLLVGVLVSAAGVAYYTTPCDMIMKLWTVPRAVVVVLFPAFSRSYLRNRDEAAVLFIRGVKVTIILVFPLCLTAVLAAKEILRAWIGSEFAQHSAYLLQWFSIGVFVYAVAHIPAELVNAAGRPELTTKLRLLEVPVFVASSWFSIKAFGLQGAVITWVIRIIVDTVILFVFATRLLSSGGKLLRKLGLWLSCALVPLLTLRALDETPVAMRLALLVATTMIFACLCWRFMLNGLERSAAYTYLAGRAHVSRAVYELLRPRPGRQRLTDDKESAHGTLASSSVPFGGA